jgi:hypothetical protein
VDEDDGGTTRIPPPLDHRAGARPPEPGCSTILTDTPDQRSWRTGDIR